MDANYTALRAFDKTLKYAQKREQFGQSLSKFQGIQWKIAIMTKRIEATRLIIYRSVEEAVANEKVPDQLQASIASMVAAENGQKIVTEAVQIHGATRYQQGHHLEYLYRLACGRRIGVGTDEIQKTNIGQGTAQRLHYGVLLDY